jgi:hypothetical protein
LRAFPAVVPFTALATTTTSMRAASDRRGRSVGE